jgi:hypothetical protein
VWITGLVVDDTGRALPGVTVQASSATSSATRCVVSNSEGRYVVQDLRPGAYTITFARPGFFTLQRRTFVSLFVATINARLQPGIP